MPNEPQNKARGVSVFLYPQGSYFTLDDKRNNIPEFCGKWYALVIKHLLAEGAIDNHTIVNLPGVYSGPVSRLREIEGF